MVVKVALVGAGGQLGQAIQNHTRWLQSRDQFELIPLYRDLLDLADCGACQSVVEHFKPDWLINAAAFTAVDHAEAQPAQAEQINAIAPGVLAHALAQYGGKMLQVSTDFVFDGRQQSPYTCDSPINPLNIYGATKAQGEIRVLEALTSKDACILRTSWVYGPVGKNFMRTILRLHQERAPASQPIAVVSDQIGRPTSTTGLAEACWRVIERGVMGVHHWSDAGATSWFEFAAAITESALQAGVLQQATPLIPIPTSDYPTAAQRPAYSVLDTSSTERALDMNSSPWRQALDQVVAQLSV